MTGSPLPTPFAAAALLFDMDGTLVDSTAVVERTWRSFADRHGLEPATILAVSHGRRTVETVAEFAPPDVDVDAEAARLTGQEVADTDGIIEVRGASALLGSLPSGSWAVVTSAGRELALARMTAAGVPVPDILISAEDVTDGKPSPEGYLLAAARLGVAAEQTVVFEDAEAGVLAARASGARTVVVGACATPATAGLARVEDFREIRVRYESGRLVVSRKPQAEFIG
jgi:sugar-phosphatase